MASSGTTTLQLFTTVDFVGQREEVLDRLFVSLVLASEAVPLEHYLLVQRCDLSPADAVAAIKAPAFTVVLTVDRQLSLSKARNIMLDRFRDRIGPDDVVAFPDDDGWYPADTPRFVADLFANDAELDLYFCRYGMAARSPRAGEPVATPSLLDVLRRASSNTIFTRGRTVLAAEGFDEDLGVGAPLNGGEDTDYALRLRRQSRKLAFSDAILMGHRDPFIGLQAKYYRGTLAAIARNAKGDTGVALQLVRKLVVGCYLVARGQLPPGTFIADVREGLKPRTGR